MHYSQIRSFKIATIRSPICTSLHNTTSLNINVFTQFRASLSLQNAHQSNIYSLTTTTEFCVASATFSAGVMFLVIFESLLGD